MSLYVKHYGSGRQLVLLHGWSFHSDVWQSIIPVLSEHWQVTVIDFPGFGRSEMLEGSYSVEQIAELMLPHINSSSTILGWSMGGYVAMHLAKHYPERVLGLMTTGCNPKFLEDDAWTGVSLDFFETFCQQVRLKAGKALRQFCLLMQQGQENPTNYYKYLLSLLLKYGEPSVSALRYGLEILNSRDMRDSLLKIQCPQLHIYGDGDLLAKFNEGSINTKVYQQCGHIPFISHQKDFIADTSNFMRELNDF
jgi:pimeloyl-[acyl-carrier protein] methyl ester esterase